MGTQTLSLKPLALALAVLAVFAPAAAAENAVGGSVRDASEKGDPALPGVDVMVVQDNKAQGKTQKPDGVYTLKVSDAHAKIDIVFTKTGYTTAFDADVPNKESNTRPVVYMAQQGTLKKIPKEHLNAILKSTLLAAERAKENKLPALAEQVKRNLAIFKEELGGVDGAKDLLDKIDASLKP